MIEQGRPQTLPEPGLSGREQAGPPPAVGPELEGTRWQPCPRGGQFPASSRYRGAREWRRGHAEGTAACSAPRLREGWGRSPERGQRGCAVGTLRCEDTRAGSTRRPLDLTAASDSVRNVGPAGRCGLKQWRARPWERGGTLLGRI